MTDAAELEPAGPGAAAGDARLLERLRSGDEAAFASMVSRWSSSMLHVAQMFVPSRAVAEEVVQETWLGVLRGIDAFEGRSSLRTWVFRILVNRAKTRGERERRTVPFAALAAREAAAGDDLVVDADRFTSADDGRPAFWATPPRRWDDSPERRLESRQTRELLLRAIAALNPMQRLVITMRDVEGWSGAEVCNALDISETNQRVLLHRARTKVRTALEGELA